MLGTDPQLMLLGVSAVLPLIAMGISVFTWYASRARKVRAVEDQIMGIVRTHRLRVEQMETQLAEWKVSLEGVLAEVQEFFERTTRERKRIQTTTRRAEEQQGDGQVDLGSLPRDAQIAAIRGSFMGR